LKLDNDESWAEVEKYKKQRKEEEWLKQKTELLETIKDKEREIDQLKTEMKFRIEMLQAEIDELTESYDILKRKYDSELTGEGGVSSLKQSLEVLKRQIDKLQAEMERLQAKMKEMRELLRKKEFELEDVKRVCADMVSQKEDAYQALLKDLNKIRDEWLEEKQKMRDQCTKMANEFKRQRAVYEKKLFGLEEVLEEERKVHTVVANLKAIVDEREKTIKEEIEKREKDNKFFEAKVKRKNEAIEQLKLDNDESWAEVEKYKKQRKELEEQWATKERITNRSWLKKQHGWEKKEKGLLDDYNKVLYALNDPAKIEKEKARLKMEKELKFKLLAKLEEQGLELDAGRIAVKEMAEANTTLNGLLGGRKGEIEKDKVLLEHKLEKERKRFKRVMVENEDLRKILILEMDKAEDTLKDLETQFLEMPNPFAEEVNDLKDRQKHSVTVMAQLGTENKDLQDELAQVLIDRMTMQRDLERKLAFSVEMLNKVKEMESLKLVGNPNFFMEIDADGSGEISWAEALPILLQKGMNENEAADLFKAIDTSGDGKITHDEFQDYLRVNPVETGPRH